MSRSKGRASRPSPSTPVESEFPASARDVTWDFISQRINDIIIVADVGGVIRYASPAVRALGYEPAELLGLTGEDLVHPEDLERFIANTVGLFRPGLIDPHADREHRFRRKDGAWVWLEGNPSPLPGPDGRPAGVLNVFRDVSDRRASRDALWEQYRRASMAEEVAGIGYWRLDAETLQATWSEQVFRMHGLEPGDTIALGNAMDRIHPDDKASSDVRVARALETGEGWRDTITRIIRPDGSLCYLRGRGICETNAAGKVIAVFGTVLDVTGEIEAQRELQDSERRYRLMAENVTDMISSTALNGRLTYLSPSVERVTGYRVEELLQGRMYDHVHLEDRAEFMKAFVDLVAGRREPGPIRFRAAHKSGRWMWLESNPHLARDKDGRPVEIVDVTREVTDEEELKAQLRTALAEAEQAAAVKAQFLANMSHEIRTPLTAVLGFSGLLSERSDLHPDARNHVGRIAGASRALLAVVNDVLDFSKLEAGEITIRRRPTNPEQAARDVLEMFALQADEKKIELRFETGVGLPSALLVDEDRLRQILTNLVGNAVKFTTSGRVTLALDYDNTEGRLSAAITDTGPGISPEGLSKLFLRFSQVDGSSTRSKGGTGLGLAICMGLAEAMDGDVRVTSEVGVGSTFRLELPALRAIAPSAASEQAASFDALADLRVLVVDDNQVNRELVRAILTPTGVDISEARDGREAVEIAQSLPFDVILMDLRMPVLDGRAALAEIRSGSGPNQSIPILAFSADGLMGPADALAIGFDGQVRKPVLPAELLLGLVRAVAPTMNDGDLPEGEIHAFAS